MQRLILGTALVAAMASFGAHALEGDPDTSFSGTGLGVYAIDEGGDDTDRGIGTMRLLDGKLLVVGTTTPNGPQGSRIVCVRLMPDGSRDATYGEGGERFLDTQFNNGPPGMVSAVADSFVLWGTRNYPIAIDGGPTKAIDGNTGDTDVLVQQVTVNCTNDATFGDGGTKRVPFNVAGFNQDIATAAFMGDVPVRIFVAAAVDGSTNASDRDFGIAVLTLSGQLDNTFSTDGRATVAFDIGGANLDVPNAIHSYNGKVLVTGYARRTDNGSTDLAMARFIGTTGALDGTLCPSSTECPDSLRFVGRRTYRNESPSTTNETNVIGTTGFDGAIYTASTTAVVSPPGPELLMLAKFLDNGSIDAGWGSGTGRVQGQLLTNTRPVFVGRTVGGVVVAGSTAQNSFDTSDSQSRMFIGRFGPNNGQGDLTFATPGTCVLSFCATFAFPGQTATDARAVQVKEIDGQYLLTGYKLFSGQDYDIAVVRTQGVMLFRNSFE